MNQQKKLWIATACICLAFTSCKESSDDDPGTTNQTKTEMLTAGPWLSTDLKLNGASLWSLVDDCEKDDEETFNADGTGLDDEGATKCDAQDPQTEPFNWEFLDNETRLAFIDDDTADIASLTTTSLVLTFEEDQDIIEIFFRRK